MTCLQRRSPAQDISFQWASPASVRTCCVATARSGRDLVWSRYERFDASITLPEYLNELTSPGDRWIRQVRGPSPAMLTGVAPYRAPEIGRATEPRLAGSPGSRHIRVTVARPTTTITRNLTTKVRSEQRLNASATHWAPTTTSYTCPVPLFGRAPFRSPGLQIGNAIARSGYQGWPLGATAGLSLTPARTMAPGSDWSRD